MLVTRLLSLLPCLLIVQFANLEKANVVLNIIQFIQLPFIIIPAIRFVSNKALMEEEAYHGKRLHLLLGFSGFLILMNLYQLSSNLPEETGGKLLAFLVIVLYLTFLGYISRCPLTALPSQLRQIPNGSSLRSDSFAC